MFGKVNKEEIDNNNNAINEEMRSTKPHVEEKKEHPAKNAIGNVLSITGTLSAVIAGVGAAVLALNYIVGALGLSAVLTVLILAGAALACQYAGNQMITNSWFPVPA